MLADAGHRYGTEVPSRQWAHMLVVVSICGLVSLATILVHQAGLLRLAAMAARLGGAHAGLVIPLVLIGIIGLHLIEIALYSGATWLLSDILHLGALRGDVDGSDLELLYFSAETFTSLGFGDILPSGPLRLLASFEPLNGLLLLGWSASFIHLEVDRYWRLARISTIPPRAKPNREKAAALRQPAPRG